MVAFYPYDGNAEDASDQGNHGAVYGPITTVGYEGSAYSFDGIDDYIRHPVIVNPADQSQLTIGAWVNASSIVPHNSARFIVSTGDQVQLPCLAQERRDGTPSERRGWSSCGQNFLFAGGADTAGEWIFLAAVYDLNSIDNSGSLTFYVQDQVYSTSVSAFSPINRDFLYVGSRIGTSPNPYHGLVDNLFIFAEALDASQIETIRTEGAEAILGLGEVLPVTYAEPEPLPAQKLPRLIGVSGDIALMAQTYIPTNYANSQHAKLILVDATNPADVHRRGEYLFEVDRKPELRMDLYSAVADGNMVYITDDSQDSTGDSLAAMPWLTDDPADYDNYKGYHEDYTSLLTFNIVDLDKPDLVNRYDHPKPARFRHMTISSNTLFINDYNYGVRSFSLVDPTHPVLAGGTTTAAEGRYAWVNDNGTMAFSTQTFGGTVYALNITNPSTLVKEGEYWDGEWVEKNQVTGRGDYLYLPTAAGLTILDVSNPNTPLRVGQFPGVYFQPAVSLFGDTAYVLTSDSTAEWEGGLNMKRFLNIYDISDPSEPVWLNESHVIDFSTNQIDLYVQGDYAYVISKGGLTIVDVQDPIEPQVIGQSTDPNFTIVDHGVPIPIQVKDGYAYIVTGERNERFFHIVDVHDPDTPTYLSTYTHTNEQHVTDLIISGKYLYLGIYWGTFWVYDITNPVSPVFVTNTAGLPLGGWGASWSLGGLIGEHLAVPALSRFHLVDVPRDNQGLIGPITVDAHLYADPCPFRSYLPILISEGN